MTHSISNSNTFLAYFNHIDKFFEVVLGLNAYMPFIEKVDRIAQGRYPISVFVRKYQHKLKYFGDLRNQVVHGFRLEQHHYLLASDYAIEQIKTMHEYLTTPPTISSFCAKALVCGTSTMSLKEMITLLLNQQLSALPLQDPHGVYQETIFEDQLMRAALQLPAFDQSIDLSLLPSTQTALFVAQTTSVYEVEGLFSLIPDDKKPVTLVWITASGGPDETILGKITPRDLPKLDQGVIL